MNEPAASIPQKVPFPQGHPSRRAGLAELIVGVGLMQLDLWYLRGLEGIWSRVLVYLAIIALFLASIWRQGWFGYLLVLPPLTRRAWLEAGLATLALACVLLVASYLLRFSDEHIEWPLQFKSASKRLEWWGGKFTSALGQQLALQLFLWPLCWESIRRRRAASVASSALFGLIHLPSAVLVGVTTVAGLAWTALFRRWGRLEPLVVSHVILATLAHAALPARVNYDMQVGIVAWNERAHFERLYDPRQRQIDATLRHARTTHRRLASEAYVRTHGGPGDAYIQALCVEVFGRKPTPSELRHWRSVLERRQPAEVVARMLCDEESLYLRR